MRAVFFLCLAACNGLAPIDVVDPAALPPQEAAEVAFGRALFFDAGLSGAGDVSCASCHAPEAHGADGRATSIGTEGAVLRRNAPSVLNAALKSRQFWDGRSDTLEDQALGPLLAPDEMGGSEAGIVARVVDHWADEQAAAYPDTAPSLDQVARALAAYQRTLPTPARFDRFLQGDRAAMTDQEVRGLRFFRQNCAFCHNGAGVGGNNLEVLGDAVPWPADRRADLGRYETTGDPADEMVFVVPSLRNVTQTAPYFHDGSVETLEEAVRLMGKHQLGETLDEATIDDVVAFLGALEAETIPAWAYAP
jgi:cytochrome c peroxidase